MRNRKVFCMIFILILQIMEGKKGKNHLSAEFPPASCMAFTYVLQIMGNLCIIRVTYRWQMAGVW